jgi:hypothetical protein
MLKAKSQTSKRNSKCVHPSAINGEHDGVGAVFGTEFVDDADGQSLHGILSGQCPYCRVIGERRGRGGFPGHRSGYSHGERGPVKPSAYGFTELMHSSEVLHSVLVRARCPIGHFDCPIVIMRPRSIFERV